MSNPLDCSANIWINANAGSGKTTLLVHRFIALVLNGCVVDKIAVITYTVTAADEVKTRILQKINAYNAMGDDDFLMQIAATYGVIHEDAGQIRATLNSIVEEYDSLQISTIHAFCKRIIDRYNVLNNYPANEILTDFAIADIAEDISLLTSDFLEQCHLQPQLQNIVEYFCLAIDSEKIQKIIEFILHNQHDINAIIKNDLEAFFNIDKNNTPNDILMAALNYFSNDFLHNLAGIVGGKISSQILECVAFLLTTDVALTKFNALKNALLNTNGLAYKTCKVPEYQRAAAMLLDFNEQYLCAINYYRSVFLMPFSRFVIEKYYEYKMQNNMIDYGDILFNANKLLHDEANTALCYDVNNAINHILVDEAQDTNFISWKVILKVADPFFTERQHNSDNKTIFVIGDDKQSIFSFQGADVAKYRLVYNILAKKSMQFGVKFYEISLPTSYRSSSTVLNLVDRVFADEKNRAAITTQPQVRHVAYNTHDGLVKIIPVQKMVKSVVNMLPNWLDVVKNDDLQERAELTLLVDLIKRLINENGTAASDIMVIIRDRFGADDIIGDACNALAKCNILANGHDRINISKHLLFYDITCLFLAIINPEDKLNNARLMRSVFFDLSLDDIAINDCAVFTSTMLSIANFAQTATPYDVVLFAIFTCKAENRIAKYGIFGQKVLMAIANFLSTQCDGFSLWQALESLNKIDIVVKNDTKGGVNFITAHSAKGMESDTVIIVDIKKNITKNSGKRSSISILKQEDCMIFTPSKDDSPMMLREHEGQNNLMSYAEEMRLLYVALTRAKNNLYIIGEVVGDGDAINWTTIVNNCMQ